METNLLYHQRLKTPLQRFEEKYMPITESGCWAWLTGDRYGTFYMSGHLYSAHKAAWLLFRGPVPDGNLVCHKCDISICVNPDHLFLGSAQDNMTDMIAKGRQKIVRGCAVGTSKLTPGQVFEIRLREQEKCADVAARYGVSPSNIRAIWSGRSWRHCVFGEP